MRAFRLIRRSRHQRPVNIAELEHPSLVVRGLFGEVIRQPGQGPLIPGPNEANQEQDGGEESFHGAPRLDRIQ